MFKEFDLKTNDTVLCGYHEPVENASHVVCVIHGIGEHMGRYQRITDYLNSDGIAVMGMDLRGHGKSPGRRGDCAPRSEVLQDIDYLIGLAKKEYPDVPLILYGHSLGGNIALDYRHRGTLNEIPDAYIISAPWIRLCRSFPEPVVKIMKIASAVVPHMVMGSAVNEEILGNLEYVRPYNKDPLVHTRISMKCAYEGFTIGRALENNTLETIGEGVSKPMLLMHGDADMICSVEGTRKVAEYENCRYIEWEGLYHEIHNGGPDSTGDEVIEAISSYVREF